MNDWRWIHTCAAAASVILLVFTGVASVSSNAPMHFVHTIEHIGFFLNDGSLVISRYDQLPAEYAFDGHRIWEFPIVLPAAIGALAWLLWGLHRIRLWRPNFAVAAAFSLLIGFSTL
jgi:hypothetical protein